jgi:predicted dehydrogenase
MNIAIIGLGSMGKRRIRILQKNYPAFNLCGIDFDEKRQKQVFSDYKINTYGSIDEAIINENPTAAFVCASPLSHAKIIEYALDKNLNVFTELNLVSDGYEKNIKTAKTKGLVLFMSSTMIYRSDILALTEKIKAFAKPLNYIYHVGQYLPSWHPYEDYKDFFIAKKETNGIREVMAVEIPWILNAFGEASSFYTESNKITGLDIDYPDSRIVVLNHITGNKGVLVFDVVAEKTVRDLEVFGEGFYVKKPLQAEKNILEGAYESEVDYFINTLLGKETPKYSFTQDKITLDLIDRLEEK